MLKITLGTQNPTKISALRDLLVEYPFLQNAEVISKEVDSGVADQPLTLDDTMRGAETRAKSCYSSDCLFSVGIESGFLEAPRAQGGLMELTVCAIYNGKVVHYGFSSGFNCPVELLAHIREGKTLNDAAYLAGYTNNPNVGAAEGIIGILTRGRVTRKEYTMQALRMTLIHVEREMM